MLTQSMLKEYQDRWQEVEAVEKRELQQLSAKVRWEQMHALFTFGVQSGLLDSYDHDNQALVWERWQAVRLKWPQLNHDG